MKQKSFSSRGESLLKWHALAFTIFTVALWWSVLSALTTHVDPATPFSVYAGFIMSRIGATLFAGLVLLAHFAFHQVRSWTQGMARQSHLKAVSAIQERHSSGVRLDVDAQGEGDMIDEEALDMAAYERQREQSR